MATPQVGRQVRGIVTEPSEVDDLLDPGAFGLASSGLGSLCVPLLEVRAAERMDEVVHDLDPVQYARDRVSVGRIRRLPLHVRLSGSLTSRDRYDVMCLRELVNQRRADRSRGPENERLHPGPINCVK
jgi:hypothetical protein